MIEVTDDLKDVLSGLPNDMKVWSMDDFYKDVFPKEHPYSVDCLMCTEDKVLFIEFKSSIPRKCTDPVESGLSDSDEKIKRLKRSLSWAELRLKAIETLYIHKQFFSDCSEFSGKEVQLFVVYNEYRKSITAVHKRLADYPRQTDTTKVTGLDRFKTSISGVPLYYNDVRFMVCSDFVKYVREIKASVKYPVQT
ncbi:MAG: hypothetical protein LBS92_00540 [Candidatus Methanoplasma sp.]|jgi:hypothetical protein|nr:hypothetical protein [Candidatus Methanoplasma sp.]